MGSLLSFNATGVAFVNLLPTLNGSQGLGQREKALNLAEDLESAHSGFLASFWMSALFFSTTA